jgi:hypothetical protein
MKLKNGSKIENTCDKNYCQLSETNLGGKQHNIHYQRQNIFHTQTYRINILLSTIQSSITSLLQPNMLMEGHTIEDCLSLLVRTNPNMSFVASYFGLNIRLYGETYWNTQITTQRSNSTQRAVTWLQTREHIMFIPWFTGHTQQGHWSMIVRHLNRNKNICFYHLDSLNQFDNTAPYALPNTPLYTPHTDSWQNIKTI